VAIGVMAISVTIGLNTDVCNYLFGSILSLSTADIWLSGALALAVLAVFALFYHAIFAVTFDPVFAEVTSGKAKLTSTVIALLTALVVVIGMRMMGTLLISSLLIFPTLTAMRVCRRFSTVTLGAALISVFCFVLGTALSYLYNLPTGAAVVLVHVALFFLLSAVGSWLRRSKCSPS
jgi:zinc transport system permease protein